MAQGGRGRGSNKGGRGGGTNRGGGRYLFDLNCFKWIEFPNYLLPTL